MDEQTGQEQAAPDPFGAADEVFNRHGIGEPLETADQIFDRYKIGSATPRPQDPEGVRPSEPDKTGQPGFWGDAAQSISTGVAQGAQRVQEAAKGAQRLYQGQNYFPRPEEAAPPIQPYQVSPETDQEVKTLLQQPISEGWTNPRWYASHVLAGLTGAWPEYVAGAAGGVVGSLAGPAGSGAGAIGGFSAASGVLGLIPNFQAARARGLDDDSAIQQAIVDSGIDAATAAAMGLIPSSKIVQGQVRKAVQGPIKEALVNLGLVVPAVGEVGAQAKSLYDDNSLRGPDEVLTDWIGNAGVGAVFVGAHALMPGRVSQTPAPAADVGAAFHDVTRTPEAQKPVETAAAQQLLTERAVTPPDDLGFYSRLRRFLETKGPESGSPQMWRTMLLNKEFSEPEGLKPEEMQWFQIPAYLANAKGEVSRADLLSHLEDNAIKVTETELGGEIPPGSVDDELTQRVVALGTRVYGEGVAPDTMARAGVYASMARNWRLNHMTRDEFTEYQRWYREVAPQVQTQYGSYTVGPKTGYKETLYHWNPAEEAKKSFEKAETSAIESNDAFAEMRRKYADKVDSNGRWIGPESWEEQPKDYKDAAIRHGKQMLAYEKAREDYNRSTTFQAPHFDDLGVNLLGHDRTTRVMDRDGKKTLVIQEMQADWLQLAKRYGFQGEEPRTAGWRAELHGHEYMYRGEPTRKFDIWDSNGKHLGPMEGKTEEEAKQNAWRAVTPPKAPFLRNWEELIFKRLLRRAADEGIERVVWTNGDQQIARYGDNLTPEQRQGLRELYDVRLPKIAREWANKLGMEWGKTRVVEDIPGNDNPRGWGSQSPASGLMHYIDLNPLASGRVQAGLPMFSLPRETKKITENFVAGELESRRMKEALFEARKASNAILGLAKSMRFDAPLEVIITHSNEIGDARGRAFRMTDGYKIAVALDKHEDPIDMYATLAHEFGHVLMWDKLETAPNPVKMQIMIEWGKWREQAIQGSYKSLIESRDNAVSQYFETVGAGQTMSEKPFNSMTPERQRYWSGFEEWFAEQTARWATTQAKPLGVVQSMFRTMAARLLQVFRWWKERTGIVATPNFFVKEWLDSHLTDVAPYAANIYASLSLRTQKASQASLDRDGTPEVMAVPLQASSLTARAILASAAKEATPVEANADAAHTDRMGAMYEHLVSLPQLAEANPHIKPLQAYREALNLFNTKIRQDHELPIEIGKDWRKLHGPQSDAVAGLIDDWANMRYLSKDEMTQNVKRMPTEEEFQKLVAKNKVSAEGLAVFRKVNAHVDSRLTEVGRTLKNDAAKIQDPVKRKAFVDSIDAGIAEERKGPYFPFMHDGEYSVELRGAVGETLFYGRARTKKGQYQLQKDIESKVQPGETVHLGFLAKDARPLSGIPGSMLDLIATHLDLSDSQRTMIEKLKAEQKPQIALIRRVRRRVATPGWSSDLMRTYFNYAFHTSRLFARVEYAPRFRGWIQQVRQLEGGVKMDQIAAFMQKHFKYVMDPKPDFATLRGLIFNLRLGFSPTTAGLYLTQTPLGTYPWLGAYFGDAKAAAAIARSSLRLSNYYKKGNLASATAPELKARAEAAKRHVLDGGAAPELAGMAENENLTANTLRGSLARGWNAYQQAAGSLLHLSDTWNRRIAFDAGWNLAMDNPNSPYIKRAINANPAEYARLQAEGWTPREAAAWVVGKHTVESTHFVYQRTHRPQVMWGKSSALLMFQFWKQNMLFTLWNYPGVRMRSLMVMAGMAGALGLPGAKDLLGFIQGAGWQLFGKDWNLEREMRNYVLDHWGPEREELADSLLHGLSRYGMGIPTVLDLLGHSVGLPKLPTVDRSSAIGLGDVLPVNLGEAFGPNRDTSGVMAKTAQDVAGAAFGYPFDLYKFLSDTKLGWNDAKRWEPVIPHWMSNISKSYRWYSQGMEKDRAGNPIVKFDANDPTQMMEILARGMGYTPTRLSQAYERRTAELEIKTYWQLRREGLMRQAWDARRVQDMEQFRRVTKAIAALNAELPQEMKGSRITPGQLLEFMRNRAKQSAMTSQGLPTVRKDIPLARRVEQMYPVLDEQSVGVR